MYFECLQLPEYGPALKTGNVRAFGATKARINHAIQALEKVNIPCLYRSKVSGVFYGIFSRTGGQAKRSLKTKDKELARRRLEELRQKVGRLNTKAGAMNYPAVRQSRILLSSRNAPACLSEMRNPTELTLAGFSGGTSVEYSTIFLGSLRQAAQHPGEHELVQRPNAIPIRQPP